MANVLPSPSLLAVRRSSRARFILVGSLVSIVCGVVALLALLPSYLILKNSHDSAEALVTLPASSERTDVARSQNILKELRPVATSTTPVLELISSALAARPTGLKVTSVSLTRGEKGTLTVGGSFPSRDAINTYRTELSKNPQFKSVSVPIGTLTSSSGGNFSITISGTF